MNKQYKNRRKAWRSGGIPVFQMKKPLERVQTYPSHLTERQNKEQKWDSSIYTGNLPSSALSPFEKTATDSPGS